MADLKLITFTESIVTPQHDALMNDAELINNGMFFGGEVTVKNSTNLYITHGIGHIYGREFEIDAQDIPVQLSASGELLGRVYIHLDLGNASNPCQLLTVTDTALPPLEDDPQINVDNGIADMEICTFKVDSTSVKNVVDTVSRDLNTKEYIDDAINEIIADKSNIKSPLNVKKGTNGSSQIYMQANANKEVLRAYGGDNNGIGIMLGAGGTTVIGGGESAFNVISNNIDEAQSGMNETLILASDTTVIIESGANMIENHYQSMFTSIGNLRVAGDIKFFTDSRNASRKYSDKWLMSEILSDIVKTQTFSTNVTATGNTSQNVTVTITVPSGYKLVDIVRVGSKNVVGICRVDSISGNKVTIKAYFLVAGTATVQATALFMRDI